MYHRSELQLNKANTKNTEAPFLDLKHSVSNGFVSSKICDMRDDFDIVFFSFWMVTFLALLPMAYTFRNLLGSLELPTSCAKLLQQGLQGPVSGNKVHVCYHFDYVIR